MYFKTATATLSDLTLWFNNTMFQILSITIVCGLTTKIVLSFQEISLFYKMTNSNGYQANRI